MRMKSLSVFLSVYIVLLSILPCDDIVIIHPSQQTEYSQAGSSACHDGVDHCSPFCTCHCCQACFHISDQPLDSIIIGFGLKYFESKAIIHNVDLFEFPIPPKA